MHMPFCRNCCAEGFMLFISAKNVSIYFGCQSSIIEKSPLEGAKMGGYALYLNKLRLHKTFQLLLLYNCKQNLCSNI